MQPKRVKDVTIKDIAEHLGISHPTVSRALRDHPSIRQQTRIAVQNAARELGYIANSGARMLKRPHSELIGVIFPDVCNDFYSATMSVLASVFLDHGYKLVLATSEDDADTEYKHIHSLREARVAGVIIAPTVDLRDESIALLAPIPTIQLLRHHSGLDTLVIKPDERASIAMAVKHLISKGHERISFIGSFTTLSTGNDRAAGYLDALRSASLRSDSSLLRQGPPQSYFGCRAMMELLDLAAAPTAVVLASPELTLGALETIQERHVRVPQDLALIGYHDPGWFKLWGAGISCIRLPVQAMATAAARHLLNQLDTTGGDRKAMPAIAADTDFKSSLILRGTT